MQRGVAIRPVVHAAVMETGKYLFRIKHNDKAEIKLQQLTEEQERRVKEVFKQFKGREIELFMRAYGETTWIIRNEQQQLEVDDLISLFETY